MALAIGEIKNQTALDILSREGTLQEVRVFGGDQQATVASMGSMAVDETLIAAMEIPPNAKIYEITQDIFDALPEAKQQAIMNTGIDLREWTAPGEEMSVEMPPSFYVLGWEANGKMHYAAMDKILTPQERSAHAAYAFRDLETITTGGGQVVSYATDHRTLQERIADSHPVTKMLDDGITYQIIEIVNFKDEVDDMINMGYRTQQIEGKLYWTKPVPAPSE